MWCQQSVVPAAGKTQGGGRVPLRAELTRGSAERGAHSGCAERGEDCEASVLLTQQQKSSRNLSSRQVLHEEGSPVLLNRLKDMSCWFHSHLAPVSLLIDSVFFFFLSLIMKLLQLGIIYQGLELARIL